MKITRVAVIGAGNGGQAFAAHFSILGFQVSLFDVEEEKIKALHETGEIKVSGAIEGKAKISTITGDIGTAVSGAELIMVVVPAVYHAGLAKAMAPYITKNQVIVLNPGATGGALEVRNTLKQNGCNFDVTVAETNTLLYACRSPKAGEVIVYGVKDALEVACIPASDIDKVVEILNSAFPQYKAVPNVLYTSLTNLNSMMHPLPTLLNAGRIDCKSEFEYYFDGLSPSIAEMVAKLDKERLAIAEEFGIKICSIEESYTETYRVQGENLYAQVQNVQAYKGIKGPTTLNTRYLFEDIPTGLVPLAELAHALGIKTPMMDSIIELGCRLLGRDFRSEGRSLEKLGLQNMGKQEILKQIV